MTPRAAALANALASATGQDWRWMECEDGTQYAALHLPSGVWVCVTAPPSASADDAAGQAMQALAPQGGRSPV